MQGTAEMTVFSRKLQSIAAGYRVTLTKSEMRGYWDKFEGYDIDDVCNGIDRAADACERMPTTGQVAPYIKSLARARKAATEAKRVQSWAGGRAAKNNREPAIAKEFVKLGEYWEQALKHWKEHPGSRPPEYFQLFKSQLWECFDVVDARHERERREGKRGKWVAPWAT